MSTENNIAIFTDTNKKCKEVNRLKVSIANSKDMTEVFPDDYTKNVNLNRFEESASVIVSKKRTLEAASSYKNTKTAVLNFASATNPGGGVTKGSSAQEEALCRVSTLYECLNTDLCMEKFYNPHREAKNPVHNGDIIYTPDVTVFKTDTNNPKDLPVEDWYNVDVITCAAPNLRPNPANKWCPDEKGKPAKVTDGELLQIHEDRLKKILDVAVDNNDESIILGAFGCGAFRNKPEIVALAARNVLKDYIHAFKNIEFAIYDKGDDINFRTFDRLLTKYKGEK